MENRLGEQLTSPDSHLGRLRPSHPGDPVLGARLASAVRASVGGDFRTNRRVLDDLYVAVRDRTRELRTDGRRAEEALMMVKHEVMDLLPLRAVDAGRAGELIQMIVRWSVAAYYGAN
jgi:hypothetical protein